MSREKVAIVAGDALFLTSKPFLQRMGAALDLEQGQVTFNKLGTTLDLEESATGHHVIDLIPGCADLSTDDSARGKASGSVKVKDSLPPQPAAGDLALPEDCSERWHQLVIQITWQERSAHGRLRRRRPAQSPSGSSISVTTFSRRSCILQATGLG